MIFDEKDMDDIPEVNEQVLIKQLRTDNEVLMEQNFDMNKSTVRLRKALSWYKNADYRADHPWCIGKEDVCIECDGGAIASKALEGK